MVIALINCCYILCQTCLGNLLLNYLTRHRMQSFNPGSSFGEGHLFHSQHFHFYVVQCATISCGVKARLFLCQKWQLQLNSGLPRKLKWLLAVCSCLHLMPFSFTHASHWKCQAVGMYKGYEIQSLTEFLSVSLKN